MSDNPYPFESEYEYKERIACDHKLLPSLVDDEGISIIDEIKQTEKTLSEFIDDIQDEPKRYPSLTNEKLIKLWLSYRPITISEISEFYSEEEYDEQAIVDEYVSGLNVSHFMKTDKAIFLREIKEETALFCEKVKSRTKIYKALQKIKKEPHTTFEKTEYNLTIVTNSERQLSFLFNDIVCTDNIPFCTYDHLCKFKSTFVDYDKMKQWTESSGEEIILKIVDDKKEYTSIFIHRERGKVVINVSVKKIIESMIEWITELFSFPIVVEAIIEKDIYGIVNFPIQKVNKYIMRDMILNDPIMSHFIAVDESINASTQKTSLLIRFKNKKGDKDAKCNVTFRVVKGNEKLDSSMFPLHSSFLRAYIEHASDNEIVTKFIDIFSKLLVVYKNKKDEVIQEYKKFIPDFKVDDTEIEKRDDFPMTLEDANPKLFIKGTEGYSRKCTKKYKPSVIHDTTGLVKFRDYIHYPVDSYAYTCKNEEYPYIGLKRNDMKENNEEYKFIPCCYKTPQNESNAIKEYYEDIVKVTKTKTNQTVIKSNTMIKKDGIGILPKNLENFLIGVFGNDIFRRKGVTNDSIINCLKEATGNKKVVIKDTYIASQENPDLSYKEMNDLFFDTNVYMDPRRWIHLLEVAYECNIYLFSRTGKNDYATIETPYYKGPYLRFKREYAQSVLLFENNEPTGLGTRQCNLIVTVKKDEKVIKQKTFDNKITLAIEQFYVTSSNKKIEIPFSIYPPTTFIYTHQMLDSYKKARCLLTKDGLWLVCKQPIPPLDIPIIENASIENPRHLVEKVLGITVDKDRDHVSIDYFTVHIKQERVETLTISLFETNRKIATVLGEYFIYKFSMYMHKEDKQPNLHTIREYIDDCIHLMLPKEKTLYHTLQTSIFDEEIMKKNGYLSKNNRVIVQNKETLKRLICLLRLRIMNNIEQVMDYYKQDEFFHFFQHKGDYQTIPGMMLMYTETLLDFNPIQKVVFRQVQSYHQYYLYLNEAIYLSEKVEYELIDKNVYDIQIVDTLFKTIRTEKKRKSATEHLLLLEYKKDDKTIYERLIRI